GRRPHDRRHQGHAERRRQDDRPGELQHAGGHVGAGAYREVIQTTPTTPVKVSTLPTLCRGVRRSPRTRAPRRIETTTVSCEMTPASRLVTQRKAQVIRSWARSEQTPTEIRKNHSRGVGRSNPRTTKGAVARRPQIEKLP